MRREKDWLTGRKCKSYSCNLKPCSHSSFLCHASHLHALDLVSDVEYEVVVAHHLYVVEQAHDETADAVHDTTPQKVEQAVIMRAMAN